MRKHIMSRLTAVITAVVLLGTLAVPVSAQTDTPVEPDFGPMLDACVDIPSAGFADVRPGHTSEDAIDCIAFYGITRGTGPSTYSPGQVITREHMALFLTRLARLVGIPVADQPPTVSFMDIGGLAPESQTAIAQLADLGITQGTSADTYSPGRVVTRWQMAVFLQRLMNLMSPVADGKTKYGYTPGDVSANKDEHPIGAPFTDLGTVTKDTFDAITELFELGVATGLSETSYAPNTAMTRAAMAEYMAAVLDHSNVRPPGLSIQAVNDEEFGEVNTTLVISLRDDMFGTVSNMAVDVFSTTEKDGALDEEGRCLTDSNDLVDTTRIDGDCVWDVDDSVTSEAGNLFVDGTVPEGKTATFYAWAGAEPGDMFDGDNVSYATVMVTARTAHTGVKVTSTVSENAACDNSGTVGACADMSASRVVNRETVSDVAFSVQLVDGDGMAVERDGLEIVVGLTRTGYTNARETVLTTDSTGRSTYSIQAPDENGQDTVTFTLDGTATTRAVSWSDADAVIKTADTTVPDYVIVSNSRVSIAARIMFYDQYGNGYRNTGQTAMITVGSDAGVAIPVNRNGIATRRVTVTTATAGTPITVSFSSTEVSGIGDETVQVVGVAEGDDTGNKYVHTLHADRNRLLTSMSDGGDANLMYTYDSNDLYLNGITGDEDRGAITMDKFEELLGSDIEEITQQGMVTVVTYNPNGQSIFQVTQKAS